MQIFRQIPQFSRTVGMFTENNELPQIFFQLNISRSKQHAKKTWRFQQKQQNMTFW